jgi:hypothetical protein
MPVPVRVPQPSFRAASIKGDTAGTVITSPTNI